MPFRPSLSSYVLGTIFTLRIDPLCGCLLVGLTFLITPRSICSALLTPTCSLPCRYSISFRFQVLLCRSPSLFPTTKVLQIEACLLSSCALGYLFFIDAAEIMSFATYSATSVLAGPTHSTVSSRSLSFFSSQRKQHRNCCRALCQELVVAFEV